MKTDTTKIAFGDQNKFECVDHNRKFYRISFDVNFRSIGLINSKPNKKIKKSSFKPVKSANNKLDI